MKMIIGATVVLGVLIGLMIGQDPTLEPPKEEQKVAQVEPIQPRPTDINPIKKPIVVKKRSSRLPAQQVKLSQRYDFLHVEKLVKNHLDELTQCFLSQPNLQATHIQADFSWTAAGAVDRITTKPTTAPRVQTCLEKIAKTWTLPPHPGMAPFLYSARFAL